MIKLPTFGGQSESQSNKEISSLLMLDFYIKSYWKQEASKDQHINISAYQHINIQPYYFPMKTSCLISTLNTFS